jgi:hypothetical protein
MTTIEMKFSFKAINELIELTKCKLEDIGTLASDFSKIAIIAHVGNKHAGGTLSIEEIENILDKEDFKTVLSIATEYGKQMKDYFPPNETSQAQ